MTTDPIAAARALIAAQPDLLFRCDLCPDECNCHPHHDMSTSGEYILCDGCEDFDAAATPPDPLKLIATLADAVEIERVKVAAAYEAAATLSEASAERNKTCPSGCRCADGWHIAMRIRSLTPADAQAALDKMLAEARLEGWRAGRDAAAVAAERRASLAYSRRQVLMPQTIPNAIRALPEPKEASHE